ncbi:hypothetical protein PR202_ga18009 [Eleusine coracana subsp. coracana]|uniref:Uncharacterized protein n=1 Tax=Eleusine coracana subsp. coracana TaxID=191504 RepID=A0AAV5CRR9_ELECO|nr:hypothetical protein PR202_ga18009 [Eleusine coracana subsp. coracana]
MPAIACSPAPTSPPPNLRLHAGNRNALESPEAPDDGITTWLTEAREGLDRNIVFHAGSDVFSLTGAAVGSSRPARSEIHGRRHLSVFLPPSRLGGRTRDRERAPNSGGRGGVLVIQAPVRPGSSEVDYRSPPMAVRWRTELSSLRP